MQRHFSGRAKTASAGLVISGHRISHGRVTGDSGRGNRPQSPDTVLRARLLRPASEAELPAKWPTLLVMAKWTAREMLRWLAVMDK